MGRKHSRSQAQIKQTESLTLHQTESYSGSNRVALAGARANIQRVNRLLKQARESHDTTREIHDGWKRELRAAGKASLVITEAENLRAQVTKLTATIEFELLASGAPRLRSFHNALLPI